MRKIVFDKPDAIIHGGDYNPEQWLDRPDILEKDIELMKKAGMNCATLGVFSWAALEREEGVFTLEWLSDIVDRLYENGIYTILATPSGARPRWLSEKYPEVLRVAQDGVRDHHGGRHNHCMQSRIYREKVGRIITELAQKIACKPGVILWHISNEFGGECFCESCVAAFRKWLKDRCGTIENLNHQWWTAFWSHTYNSFDQIEPPYSNGEYAIMGLKLDWKRFTTWSTLDYMNSEIALLRTLTPDIPVTTNFMRTYDGIDYKVISEPLDVISWDSYPEWNNDHEPLYKTAADVAFDHAQMRGFRAGQPFMLMESVPSQVNWHRINKLKRPGVHMLSCMQAVACGSDTVQYFQWRKGRGCFEQNHGAVVDHLGRDDTRVFKEVSDVGRALKELSEVRGSLVGAKAAVIYDTENRWAIEGMMGFKSHDMGYEQVCRRWHRALTVSGVDADVIPATADLSPYSLIIAPMLYMTDSELNRRIRSFAENGGVIAATFFTGYVNESTLNYLGGFPGELTDVFGMYAEECDTLYPSDENSIIFGGERLEVRNLCEVIKPLGAEALGVYGSDFYKGTPALLRNIFGKGKAYYIAADVQDSGAEKIVSMLLDEAGIAACQLPQGVEKHTRTADGKAYEFYLNFTDREQCVDGLTLPPLGFKMTVK